MHENQEPWRANLGQTTMSLVGRRSSMWWTGVKPDATICPGRSNDGVIRGIAQININQSSREEVQDYLDNGWLLTELLFSSLQGEEAFYRPPFHGLRHPLIFYYVHPAVLYVNKLVLAGLCPRGVRRDFEALFETGVDEMRWDDMSKNAMKWPSIDEAHAYRQQVYRLVSRVIVEHPDFTTIGRRIDQRHKLWALFMGFEHERIHFETSAMLIRELPIELVRRPEFFAPLHPSARSDSEANEGGSLPDLKSLPSAPFLHIGGGTARVGKRVDEPFFGWDNEYGERVVDVASFEVQSKFSSNADYLQFVIEGGYRDSSLWSEEGAKWCAFRHTRSPTFWRPEGPQGSHRYKLRTLFEEIPMPWDWPVIVNGHEAAAFVKWQSRRTGTHLRLPTEAEYHRLRDQSEAFFSSKDTDSANVELRWGSESPVSRAIAGTHRSTQPHLFDVRGNLWHWCGDDFHSLPGFQIHELYDDFSTPCFDGEHQMILGGSFVSTGDEAAPWARFHFRPHFHQHAGVRMVRTSAANTGAVVRIKQQAGPATSYESDDVLNEYMLMHYGSADDLMPYAFGPREAVEFPRRSAELGLDWAKKLGLPIARALDVGCAVGGATFRLAAAASSEVVGVDLSARFIDAASELQKTGYRKYFRKDEGDLGAWLEAKVGPPEVLTKVHFRRGDACALPPDLGEFDLVLLANLLCRIPSPRSCLSRMSGERGLVRPGGLLVLTTPFTWSDAYTPKAAWLGGREVAQAAKWSRVGLLELLSKDFELLEQTSLPLVIREHSRKFQYIVPDALVLRRLM